MSTTSHPELQDGEVLFCYATEGQFASFGEALKRILRKGDVPGDDCHPIKGTDRKDYHPYFAKISDLDETQRRCLGIAERPQERALAQVRLIDVFREFTGASQEVHTSKGVIDLSDRRSRGHYV